MFSYFHGKIIFRRKKKFQENVFLNCFQERTKLKKEKFQEKKCFRIKTSRQENKEFGEGKTNPGQIWYEEKHLKENLKNILKSPPKNSNTK